MLLEGHSTARLRLRKVRADDFERWLPFYDDPESTRYWKGLPQNKWQACTEQFDRIFERYEKGLGGMMALESKEDRCLIGLCGLLLQHVDGNQEWEIGYSILPQYRGKGYATEAARYFRDVAFAAKLSGSLISIIHIDNQPSQSVALRNGMELEKETIYKDNPVYIYRVLHPDTSNL